MKRYGTMKRKIIFSIISVVVLIVIVQLTRPVTSKAPQRIEDVIWQMFSSAKNGDVQKKTGFRYTYCHNICRIENKKAKLKVGTNS